jgi:hypothetical protein
MREYKAQIEEVQSRSAEKRKAREAASISPEHEVWLTQHDHTYPKSDDGINITGNVPDIGPDRTPNTKGERVKSGDTSMDVSGYTNLSLIHSFTSEDMMASTIPDLVGASELGPPIELA